MASTGTRAGFSRRSAASALLALLLFFYEQTALAQTTNSIEPTAGVTVGAGAQWGLVLLTLGVSLALFFAVVRGIAPRRDQSLDSASGGNS